MLIFKKIGKRHWCASGERSKKTLMNDRSYRLLLVDEQPKNYHLINTYIAQLNEKSNYFYKIDWISLTKENQTAFLSGKYDAYLIDSQLLPSLSALRGSKPEASSGCKRFSTRSVSEAETCFSSKKRSVFTQQIVKDQVERVSPAPVIILTDNYERGMMAIEAGAADYLDKTQLTLSALERSLRLTLACGRLQQQNKQLKQKIAVNFSKKSKNDPIEGDFSAIFERAPVGIALISTSGKLLRVNPKLCCLLGYSETELCSRTFQDITHPDDLAASWQYLKRIWTESRCESAWRDRSWQKRSICKDGRWQWVNITASLVKDSRGLPLYSIAVIDNIQECRQAISQPILPTSYHHLVRSLTLKIRQSLDLKEIFQFLVAQLQQTLHADRVLLFQFLPDGSGKTIEEAVLPDFPVMLGKVISDEYCQEQLSLKYSEEYVHVCPDVERAELSPCHRQFLQQYRIRANLILPIFRRLVTDPHSTAIDGNTAQDKNCLWGLLCVQQCSQPRYWSEDEIELLQQLGGQLNMALSQAELLASEIKQRQELARSNAELEQFAYIASHDLQAPLHTIANYAQLLKRRYCGQLDEKADKFINYIVDGAQRMQTQINDLLEYSRYGRQKSTFRDTDCNLVVEQAIANLRSEIEQNEVIITCQDNLPTLIADSSQLIVLFQNLLGNSIKYRSLAQPIIKIRAIAKGNSWQFSVTDNGIGIEPKYQQRIFQIFQRLHAREEYPGNGMGLAICQKIVECHGGKIWVDSQLNCGATFYFTLPARSSSP